MAYERISQPQQTALADTTRQIGRQLYDYVYSIIRTKLILNIN